MRSKNNTSTASRIEQKRRDEIIACAIEALCNNGYAAVTLTDIADRTGLTKGTLLYYYKNKEALIEAVVQSVYVQGANFMRPAIDAETTMAGKLHAYIKSNIMFMQAYPAHIVAFVSIITNISLDQQERLEMVMQNNKNTIHMLASLLKVGQQQGEFNTSFDPQGMALVIRGVIDGAAMQVALDTQVKLTIYADHAAAIFVHNVTKE